MFEEKFLKRSRETKFRKNGNYNSLAFVKQRLKLGFNFYFLFSMREAYFLGCWMILGLLLAPAWWVGIGFSWYDCTASFGYASDSPIKKNVISHQRLL
jgi:hypothetical protein